MDRAYPGPVYQSLGDKQERKDYGHARIAALHRSLLSGRFESDIMSPQSPEASPPLLGTLLIRFAASRN